MRALIALGSNLGDRRAALSLALDRLAALSDTPPEVSSVWVTEPVDADGPEFWNMAARIDVSRGPFRLMDSLLEIEVEAGRERTYPNAPRVLDLDLLAMGAMRICSPRLRLPHPRMWERRFVLEPLAEIAPGFRPPGIAVAIDVRAATARLAEDPEHSQTVRRLGPLASAV